VTCQSISKTSLRAVATKSLSVYFTQQRLKVVVSIKELHKGRRINEQNALRINPDTSEVSA
jgi:hypothetical protein